MKINLTIENILNITGGVALGNTSFLIFGANSIENASHGEITFYRDKKYEKSLLESDATAIVIKNDTHHKPKGNQVFILVEDPYQSIVKLAYYIESLNKIKPVGIHPTSIIEASATIADNVAISSNCYIAEECVIGENVTIRSNTVLGKNVSIGANTYIYPNVTICSDSVIGANCIIHPGAVIGSEGFGYLENSEDGSYTRIPQIGRVILEDDVEIGANSTIDRAMLGVTIIRKGTKIDNLVQIGHNCDIGEHNGIAAQAGISGSVKTGNRNRFAGQAGVAGHIEICDDVTIMAQSGVSNTIKNKGIYFGSPAKPRLTAFKIEAAIRNLPEIVSDITKIKKNIQSNK